MDSRIKIRAMALRAVAQSYMGEFQIAENQLERARLLSVGLEESIESIQNLLDCAVVAANQGHTKAVESALFTASAMLKHWPALLTPLMEQLPERIYGAAANRNRQLALRLYQWGTDIPDSNPTHKIVFTRETGDRFYGLKDYKTAAELWLRITDSLACSSEPLPSWFEFATITRLACMKCGKTAEAARLQALCTKLRDHQAPMTRIRHAPWSS